MAQKRSELAQRVEQRSEAAKVGVSKTMDEWIQHYGPEFNAALPAHVDGARFLRLCLNELRFNPGLRDCDPYSLIGALMICAQLGLEPSGPLNHVALTPFQRNLGTREQPRWVQAVQIIIQYQGYTELATRTGKVKTITADVVYEADDFDAWMEDGLYRIRHRPPKLGKARGEIIGAYAVAALVDGSVLMRVVDMEEIEKAKSFSKQGSQNKGPWVEHFEAMARKTAVRRLWPWLPKSAEGATAFALDARVVTDVPVGSLVDDVPILDVVADYPPDDEREEKEEPGVEVVYAPNDPARPFEEGT
jgi:recombination protein RecT